MGDSAADVCEDVQLPPLVVSLHMPKTAGNSFLATLDDHFGRGLHRDYADYPLHVAPQERHRQALQGALSLTQPDYKDTLCVHGHFLPVKYLLLADQRPCVFATWLREPIARLVSHYHYWNDVYDPDSADIKLLHRRVVEEKWSLQRFCLSPELRNVYSQLLWGFPLERFDFIGITENYENDLHAFSSTYLGKKAPAHALNRRQSAESTDASSELTGSLRHDIEQWHAADMALYQRAVRAGRLIQGAMGRSELSCPW